MATTLQIFRGDTPTFRFVLTDQNTGTAFNITGWTGQFYAKGRSQAAPTWDVAVTIIDGPNGICEATLTASNTATVDTYDAELEMRKASPVTILTAPQFVVVVNQDYRTAA